MTRRIILTALVLFVFFFLSINGEEEELEIENDTPTTIRHSRYVIKRKLRSAPSEEELKIRHYFQISEDEVHGGVWDENHSRQKREVAKRVRRNYVVRCCGGQSCLGSEVQQSGKFSRNLTKPARRKVNYDVLGYDAAQNKLIIKKRKRPNGKFTAVAKLMRGGISISCPKCPENWQSELRLKNRVGTIPVVCPGCPPNWREYLPDEFKQTSTEGATSMATPSAEEVEEVDPKAKGEFGSEIEVVTEVVQEEDSAATKADEKTEKTTEEATAEDEAENSSEESSTEEAATLAETTTPTAAPTSAATTAKPALTLPAGMTLPPGMKMPANLPANLSLANLPPNLPAGFGGLAALLG